ncbi:MAG: sensor histidine kinase [Vallitalea sp.]|nr:sensor histidine kinase [Vallitalea sp.]
MRRKIFWVNTIIMIISLMILSFFWNNVALNLNIENAKKNTVRELALINNSLDLFIETVNDYAINISIDNRIQNALNEYSYKEPTMNFYKINRDIVTATMEVLGLSNNIVGCDIVATDDIIFHVSEFFDEEIEKLIKTHERELHNQVEWSNIVQMRHMSGYDKNIFVIQKRIIDLSTYKLLGVEYMYVDERDIAKIYLNNIKNDENEFYILNNKNVIVSSSENNSINKSFINYQGLNKQELNKLIENKNGVIKVNKESYFSSIQKVDSLDWTVISMIPIKELKSQTKLFDAFILIIGIIYLIVGVIVSVLVSYSISKPINKLVLTMNKINSGNREVRADTNNTKELQVLSTTFNRLMDKNENLILQLIEEEKAIRNYEFMLLQAQIKPHFLYNTLETISSFVKLNMQQEALNSIHCLANFCRISLSNGKDIITIREELKLVESYLTIQKYRNIKYLDFEIDFNENILDNKIPKFTLQPIIENSIYHGMKPKREKTKVQIKGRCKDGFIIITVKDNGIGIPEYDVERINRQFYDEFNKDSFGLHSVNSRIKIYYGDNFGINIESKYLDYTIVSIKLPNERSSNNA